MTRRRTFAEIEAAATDRERQRCVAHAKLWAMRAAKKNAHAATQFTAFAQDLETGLHGDDDTGAES